MVVLLMLDIFNVCVIGVVNTVDIILHQNRTFYHIGQPNADELNTYSTDTINCAMCVVCSLDDVLNYVIIMEILVKYNSVLIHGAIAFHGAIVFHGASGILKQI